VQEVGEVPERHSAGLRELVERVVGAEQLHAHDGEDEDDDRQYEGEIAERSHSSTDNTHEQTQRRPRLG